VEPRIDTWLVLSVLGILACSLATLYAVAPVVGRQLFARQLLWGCAGLVVLWIMSRIHVTVYDRLAPVAYGASLFLLIAVLLWGEARSGTRGWFVFGPVSLQPSEFARLGTLLLVGAWLGRRTRGRLVLGEATVVTLLVGLPAFLILLEPDLGVALTYLPILGAAFILGGLPGRAWVILALLVVTAAGATWQWGLKPYQKERVLTVINPERDPFGAGYQVRQSKIAVGAGQIAGAGLGRGSQSLLRFLPAQHTDFIFAAWAEATGFLGATGLMLFYALLLSRIGVIAATAGNRHGLILATLIGAWIAFQVVVNLGMVVGWLPTTGITLPLFSYGGSSLLTICAGLGVVQSVWRHRLVNL